MSKVVLDASAFLALINNEKGKDVVEEYLPYSIISTVNLAEVAAKLYEELDMEENHVAALVGLIPEVVEYNKAHALSAALLKNSTKEFGLSLGDRACLALAKELKLPAVTADKAWSKINIGVKIKQIR